MKPLSTAEEETLNRVMASSAPMDIDSAGKVLTEFKTVEENILATELLERIRTLGLRRAETGAPRDSSDADRLANAR